jgi:periplasmic protein CpxP/Spy
MSSSVKVSRASQRGGLRLVLIAMMVSISATVAMSAWAQPEGGLGMGGPGRGMMFGGSPEHMGRMIDHMLDGLSASDAQRSQIKQIAQAAATDLKAQREAGRALRERGMQIFAAPTVDAAAAEQVRQQMLAQHDQSSRRVLKAMLDISQVLTPEQRAKVGERMKQRSAQMQERMQRLEREQPRK